MAPVPVSPVPPANRWYPNFPHSVDPKVADAISRLYDIVYQLSDQVQLLAQYLNKNP